METDEILQGLVYALFGFCGLGMLVNCIRTRIPRQSEIKESPSMEDLTSVSMDDPQA